jgi:hypothetical protein
MPLGEILFVIEWRDRIKELADCIDSLSATPERQQGRATIVIGFMVVCRWANTAISINYQPLFLFSLLENHLKLGHLTCYAKSERDLCKTGHKSAVCAIDSTLPAGGRP